MVYKFFDKKSSGSGVNTHANKERPLGLATHQVAEELHKPVIKNLKKSILFWIQRQYLGCWFSWHEINKQV